MKDTYKRKCPICKVGTIKITEWYYPSDKINPEDGGWELEEQKCECNPELITDIILREE